MKHKSFAELQKNLDDAAKQIVVGGIYSHYKHPENLYKVHALAVQEATDTICVIYEPQYYKGVLFVRDAEKWLENISEDGKDIQRFTLVP